jgi:hypothetical protein
MGILHAKDFSKVIRSNLVTYPDQTPMLVVCGLNVDLRMDTKKTHVYKRVDYVLKIC